MLLPFTFFFLDATASPRSSYVMPWSSDRRVVVDDTIIRISQSIISGSVKTRVPGTRVASARRQDRIKADDSKRVCSRARNNFQRGLRSIARSVAGSLFARGTEAKRHRRCRLGRRTLPGSRCPVAMTGANALPESACDPDDPKVPLCRAFARRGRRHHLDSRPPLFSFFF